MANASLPPSPPHTVPSPPPNSAAPIRSSPRCPPGSLLPARPPHNSDSSDRPDPIRLSSALYLFALCVQCYPFSWPVSFLVCTSSAHPFGSLSHPTKAPAFSSHLGLHCKRSREYCSWSRINSCRDSPCAVPEALTEPWEPARKPK